MSSRIILPVIATILLVAYFSLFRVYQWEQAIVFKFREIEHSTAEPGLHIMIPLVNTVQKFETRLLNFDQEPQRFLTSEKKDVIVDYYVKWRISNVENFYTATRGGDILIANGLLGQRINRALRDEFGRRTVQEVVAGARGEILDIVQSTTDMVQKELTCLRKSAPRSMTACALNAPAWQRIFAPVAARRRNVSRPMPTVNARSYWRTPTRTRKPSAARVTPRPPKFTPRHTVRTRSSFLSTGA
jgi:HflC protein